ncbi:ATP-binding protein [Halomicrobium sp. IBSBa]|nr:ATP-binding protein [Halomicrobium sp. IBSBa]
MESNAQEYESMAVLDYCGEYRGLVKEGIASHWIVGRVEEQWSVSDWVTFLQNNPFVVLERNKKHLGTDRWRDVCATIASALRRLDRDQLVVIDEAHFVAPQQMKLPQPIKELATTGRGAGTSSMWVTQRPAEIDKTVLTQCQARMIGGFDGLELGALSSALEYPAELHDNTADPDPRRVPDELLPPDRERPTSLQKHEDEQERTIGSEWIYSDDDGEQYRVNTQNVTMDSTHYGSEGNDLNPPQYG